VAGLAVLILGAGAPLGIHGIDVPHLGTRKSFKPLFHAKKPARMMGGLSRDVECYFLPFFSPLFECAS
jgi:hypothetical protein